MQPFVSVIIPFKYQPHQLSMCLEALQKQTYPSKRFEIIVVDNDSNVMIDEYLPTGFKNLIIESEKRKGPSAARNKGLQIARGEIIAFTDSDCVPAELWLENGVKALTNSENCGLIGGKVVLTFKDPIKPTAVELYESVTAFNQKKYIREMNFGVTANLLTFRKIVTEVGDFDVQIDCGEDQEWCHRIYAKGYNLIFSEDAVISHPARYSRKELDKKTKRLVGVIYQLGEKYGHSYFSYMKGLVFEFFKWKDTYNAISNNRLNGGLQRFWVALVAIEVKFMRIRERARLLLGAKASWHY